MGVTSPDSFKDYQAEVKAMVTPAGSVDDG